MGRRAVVFVSLALAAFAPLQAARAAATAGLWHMNETSGTTAHDSSGPSQRRPAAEHPVRRGRVRLQRAQLARGRPQFLEPEPGEQRHHDLRPGEVHGQAVTLGARLRRGAQGRQRELLQDRDRQHRPGAVPVPRHERRPGYGARTGSVERTVAYDQVHEGGLCGS